MKLLRIIKEEIVPLSSRQNLVLLIIIACIFQFVLFYTPALADEAVSQTKIQANITEDDLISNDSVSKESIINSEAAKLTTPIIASSTPEMPMASSTPAVKVLKTSTHVITAYNSEAAQTDDDPCTTANGFNVCLHGVEDTIAANFLKFGTKVKIPELFGDRVFVVRDRMNKKHADRVDVWMKKKHEAIHFGVKVAKIQVIE